MNYIENLAKEIEKHIDLDAGQITEMIEVPSDETMGDFALPCFKLAKTLKKAPPMIANDIAKNFNLPEGFKEFKVIGAYLNFFIDPVAFIKSVVIEGAEEG
ncbi:MAG: arginine--tRNA ligase, partial [Eubacteriales bacterium]